MSGSISVRARFERFPATVKGAFILRGEDPDPHQVVFLDVRMIGVGTSAPDRSVPVSATTLDVAPHRDVFVPFEVMVADLDPGWYGFELDLEVDGARAVHPGGRRFAVPWPRGTVRREQVKPGRAVALGDQTQVVVEQLDCAGESSKLSLRVEPPGPLTVRLLADGARLEVLDVEADEESGRVLVTAYPLLRSHSVLRVELRGRGRGTDGALDLRLP